MEKINFIDLFSGCGGLSEGFTINPYMNGLAHVEWEMPMVNTLRHRLKNKWGYSTEDALQRVIHFDIQLTEELIFGKWSSQTRLLYENTNAEFIAEHGMNGLINKKVDVIIGGPPCQAYSIAGRAQDPHSMQHDYRNFLFESFVEVVKEYKPKIFVFENVPGLLSAKIEEKYILDDIFSAFDDIGYEIRKTKDMRKSVYDCSEYGVPQKRRRIIIFGVRKDSEINLEQLYKELDSEKTLNDIKTVYDSIGHLPKIYPLSNSYKQKGKNISHAQDEGDTIIHHEPRYNNLRDIKIFNKWISNNMNTKTTKTKLDFYFDHVGKKSNHNKYRNLEWDKPSPTIVAHLYKDGLMFIHPDEKQSRSITIKEAALLQTFPDDFEFIGSNASSFKMIGNAVPVKFGTHIANAVEKVLREKK